METAERLNEFLKNHDPFEYNNECTDINKVQHDIKFNAEDIINYLLDIIEETES